MPRSLMVLFSLLLVGALARAGDDFAPIPPSVWAIKEGPKGAVVLEDRMSFTVTTIDYVYRVRVFSEEGKAAAAIRDLPSTADKIRGRTVYPDGRQVLFNSRKDFGERLFESGAGYRRFTHLVAPGVISDCVMELKWTEPADGIYGGLPWRFSRGLYKNWVLANPFPTQLRVIEIGKMFPLTWRVKPGVGSPPESALEPSGRRLTFRNLPPHEIPPYSIAPTLNLPTLIMFKQWGELGDFVRQGPDAYWQKAIKSHVQDSFEESIGRGPAYKAFSKELTSNLPKDPTKAAAELLMRLEARIANLSTPSRAEAVKMGKNFWIGFRSKEFDEAVKNGYTDAGGMQLLFFHLLRDAGITPKLAKVPDRDVALFDWEILDYGQVVKELIGVDSPNAGTVWFDPTLRFAAPGVFHPDFAGVPALIIDTREWKASRGGIAAPNEKFNAKQYTYSLELAEDLDRISVNAVFGGYPEYLDRSYYWSLEATEQAKMLKEKFEKGMKNLVVEFAEVQNTTSAKANVTWQLKGILEREVGRNRIVDPFPGMPWPLWIPSKLEETRSVPIILPYLSTQVAISTFNIPKGFRLKPDQGLKHENPFGKVSWELVVDEVTGLGKVVLLVEVSKLSAGPDQWDAFRTYLSWIEDACRRQVTLVREG